MRVVIVTESFPPDVNGVAHCALQTARHLVDRGHIPVVVAPAPHPGTSPTPSRRASSSTSLPSRSQEAFADAVDQMLERLEADRREGARARAECFGWETRRSTRFSPRTTLPSRCVRPGRSCPGAWHETPAGRGASGV